MSKIFKKKFEIIILDEEKSNAVLELIDVKNEYYRSAYDFDAQYHPRKFEDITWETVGFKIESEISENDIQNKLSDFYNELDKLNVNYVLRDMDTKKVLRDIDFEFRTEIIVHFTSITKLNNRIIRKFYKISNLLKIYGIIGWSEKYEKITVKDSTECQRGFISICVKLYSQSDNRLRELKEIIIKELEKLNEEFELEINHLD